MITRHVPHIAAAAILLLAELGAAAPGNKPFQVSMTGLEVRAVEGEAIGADRRHPHGKLLLKTSLGLEHGALLQEPLSVTVAGLDFRLRRNAPLLAARAASGGDLGSDPSRIVFCGEMEKARRADRYGRQTRLCLVDTDRDRRFDKAFIVGTKKADDWRLTDIAPVGYSDERHIPLGDGWELTATYVTESATQGRFDLGLQLNGQNVTINAVKLWDQKWRSTPAWTSFDSTKLPFRYQIGSAVFVVTAMGPDGIVVRQETSLDYAPLDYNVRSPQPQILFISY